MSIFRIKVVQINCDFLAYFEKYLTLIKPEVANLWGNFLKILATFLFQHLVTLNRAIRFTN